MAIGPEVQQLKNATAPNWSIFIDYYC